jgi:hypothetical protein
MAGHKRITRRGFLQRATATLAGPTIVRASALGRDGRDAPSERITLGYIGMGGRAGAHLGLGRPLKWDPVKEQFVGDDAAGRWLDRPRRPPWTL